MYGPGDKWRRATVEVVEGPSSYRVRTEDGDLHRRHADQILARTVPAEARLCENIEPKALTETDLGSSDEPLVAIPPPEMWPDIIGVPNSSN